jgi:glycosyltransferase involved in cell wall biosynthesis
VTASSGRAARLVSPDGAARSADPGHSHPTAVGRPRLAVLITYYNEGPLLRECIESVADQPGAPDEILVYDDASSNPAERWIPRGAPVRILRGERNAGQGHGRNDLLLAASADYVHCHDADDLFAPEWAQAVREAIGAADVDVVLTEIRAIDAADGRTITESVLGLHRLYDDPDLVRFGLRGSLLVPSTTYRVALARRLGGYLTRDVLTQSEDFHFHVRLAAAAETYTFLTEPLITQRIRAGSSSSDRRACWTSAAAAVEMLSRELPRSYEQDLSDASARIAAQLYQLRVWDDADAASRQARKLGRPNFHDRPLHYRLLARALGQPVAERAGRVYRRLLPPAMRRVLGGS